MRLVIVYGIQILPVIIRNCFFFRILLSNLEVLHSSDANETNLPITEEANHLER